MSASSAGYAAVPTEYRGIKMRSKSEAIFAACLDFAGWAFEYEPTPTVPHRWDFLALREDSRRVVLIEYKPRQPTMTYVDNLINKVREPAEQHASRRVASGRDPYESYVVWGSPLSDQGYNFIEDSPFVCYPIFTRIGKYGWGDFIPMADHGEEAPFSHRHPQTEILGITDEHIEQAMAYRFDLKA